MASRSHRLVVVLLLATLAAASLVLLDGSTADSHAAAARDYASAIDDDATVVHAVSGSSGCRRLDAPRVHLPLSIIVPPDGATASAPSSSDHDDAPAPPPPARNASEAADTAVPLLLLPRAPAVYGAATRGVGSRRLDPDHLMTTPLPAVVRPGDDGATKKACVLSPLRVICFAYAAVGGLCTGIFCGQHDVEARSKVKSTAAFFASLLLLLIVIALR